MRAVIRRGGGVGNGWCPRVWLLLIAGKLHGAQPRHVLAFRAEQQAFRLEMSVLKRALYSGKPRPIFTIDINTAAGHLLRMPNATGAKVEPDVSILAQRRDPETYPVITIWLLPTTVFVSTANGRLGQHCFPDKTDSPADR